MNSSLGDRHRVLIVTALVTIATVAAVAVGGVPLIVGLGGLATAAVLLLPAGSRSYLIKRTFRVVVSVFVGMAFVWLMIHNLPDSSPIRFEGDNSLGSGGLSSIFGDDPEIDRGVVPAIEAYGQWLGGLVAGELGYTTYSETVGDGVSRTIPLSLQLLAYSQLIAITIAVPGAIVGAWLRGRAVDVGFRAVGLLGLSTPVYVIGPLLVFFFAVGEFGVFGLDIGFKVLPAGRYTPIGESVSGHIRSMLLPSVTLGLTTAAAYLVLLRSEMVQQLTLDHVLLARSKGVPKFRVVRDHAIRPAAPTAVAAIAAQSGLILGNLILVERIFLLPGFGDYVIVAFVRRDLPAIAGALFVIAIILGVINLIADAVLLVVDPRLDSLSGSG